MISKPASNLRQSGIYLTVELPDGTEVDLDQVLADNLTTLARWLIDRGHWDALFVEFDDIRLCRAEALPVKREVTA